MSVQEATMRKAALILAVASIALTLYGQLSKTTLKIELVMTPEELRAAGITTLNNSQRQALNDWLNRYTERIIRATLSRDYTSPSATVQSNCSPAIESTISGEFHGWDGETIFKLDNGQIWKQAEYDYTYSYSYRPDVTIYSTSAGCRMKVEDEEETILVRRIK
jgi:hypothetical protein